MIRQTTYFNAANFARKLEASNQVLRAKDSTPVSELIDLSASCFTTREANNAMFHPNRVANQRLHSALTGGPVTQLTEQDRANEVFLNTTMNFKEGQSETQHSLKIDALATDLAKFIQAHISHARTVVKPLVLDLLAKMDEYQRSAKPEEPAGRFCIEQGQVPAVLLDETFLAMGLENYVGVKKDPARFPAAMAKPESLMEIINLGNERLNKMVQAWLQEKDPQFLEFVFIHEFGAYVDLAQPQWKNFKEKYRSLSQYHTEPASVYDRLDVALATYLLSTGLMEHVQKTPLSLTDYRSHLRKVIDYAGVSVLRCMATINGQIQSQIMVTYAEPSKYRMAVHKEIYQAYLTEGGCPEALLGMLVSGEVTYLKKIIHEKKEPLCRFWENYLMLAESGIRKTYLENFRQFVINTVLNSMEELTESEKEFTQNVPDLKSKVFELLKAELTKIDHRLIEDLPHTALHAVAKCRFYYTSAYTILNGIQEVSKQNPEIEVREAATLSAIAYLAEYYATQLSLERV